MKLFPFTSLPPLGGSEHSPALGHHGGFWVLICEMTDMSKTSPGVLIPRSTLAPLTSWFIPTGCWMLHETLSCFNFAKKIICKLKTSWTHLGRYWEEWDFKRMSSCRKVRKCDPLKVNWVQSTPKGWVSPCCRRRGLSRLSPVPPLPHQGVFE